MTSIVTKRQLTNKSHLFHTQFESGEWPEESSDSDGEVHNEGEREMVEDIRLIGIDTPTEVYVEATPEVRFIRIQNFVIKTSIFKIFLDILLISCCLL